MKPLLFMMVILIACFSRNVCAQKPAKGSSPDRPWSNDVYNHSFPTAVKNDTNRMDKNRMDFKEELLYGKWWLITGGSYFLRANERLNRKEPKLWPIAGAADVYDTLTLVNNINIKGTDPDKNKFAGRFFFSDKPGGDLL